MPNIAVWKQDLDRWGLRRFVWLRVMVALRRQLVLCRVQLRVVDPPSADPTVTASGCAVRVATRAELLRAAADSSMALNTRDIETAHVRGDVCVGAFDGDRLVSYAWRSFNDARWAPRVWVTCERPYPYVYKVFTHPTYRGRALATAVARFADDYCATRGYTHAVSLIETHNHAAIASERKRGSRVAGWAGYVTVGQRHYPFRSPRARHHGLALHYVPGDVPYVRPSVVPMRPRRSFVRHLF